MITFIVALLFLVGGHFFVWKLRGACIAPEGPALSGHVSYIVGGACTLIAAVGFATWYRKQNSLVYEKI